jgi:two-component system chemotaxis response regulator CheB
VKKLRVAIVDDSAVCRDVLREILEEEGDIEVTGEASDGLHALSMLKVATPDLVTVDIDMPKMGGLATVKEIMAHRPVPILIVTGRPSEHRSATLFEAVQRGALDLAEKPTLGRRAEAVALRKLVRSLAKVPVMRHVAGTRMSQRPHAVAIPVRSDQRLPLRLVGIGASAGGPAAIATVLQNLPLDLPLSIVLVQHLLPGFATPFAQFLRDQTGLRVVVVDAPMSLRPGTVFLPSDDHHVVATLGDILAPTDGPARDGHRPSVDVLFKSLAEVFGSSAMGVLLSGMGQDGVSGLTQMRATGALTVAQDKETSAVYGMPRVAIETAAARVALAPAEIAAAIKSEALRETLR